MSATSDGGPAFPRAHTVADANDPCFKLGHTGMTLRDYFAAKAMEALIQRLHRGDERAADVSAHSYQFADAMLAERQKGGAS